MTGEARSILEERGARGAAAAGRARPGSRSSSDAPVARGFFWLRAAAGAATPFAGAPGLAKAPPARAPSGVLLRRLALG